MPVLSIRIPDDMSRLLDRAAKCIRRSRSSIVQEALNRYLDGIVPDQHAVPTRLERLRMLKGAGAQRYGALNSAQIAADIREFRGGI